MTTISVRIIFATAALMLPISLGACGQSDSGPEATGPQNKGPSNCQTLPQPTIKPETPTIAILGVEGPALEAYNQDADVIINAAKATKARVIVNGVSEGPHSPNLLSNVILEGEGNNNLARTTDLTCKTGKVLEAISSLKKGNPAERADAFSALNALSGNLSHNPSTQPIDVVLLTPLVAHGGGVDLADPKTLADPSGAINKLAAQGLIPSCQNWRVYGVSPASGLSDVLAAQLKEFWIAYIQKCGGNLVAWEDHLAAFPATNSISRPDTSQLNIEHTDKEVIGTLGADVLFGANSTVLLDSATPALTALLDLTHKYAGKIFITGHVNPLGPTNTDADTTTSQQRGEAVRNWFVAHGVPNELISVIGKGSTEPIYPHPATDAEAAANRRVVVTINSAV